MRAWAVVAWTALATAASPAGAQPSPLHVRWRGGIGWQMNVDGVSPAGQQSAMARMGVAPGRFELGVEAALAIPAQVDDGRSRLELVRASIAVTTGFVAFATPDVRVVAGSDIGLVGLRRETIALHDSSLRATASRWVFSPLLAPCVRATWWIDRSAVGLEAAFAIESVVALPWLVYREGDELTVAQRPWPVQPRFAIALIVRSRSAGTRTAPSSGAVARARARLAETE